MKYIKIDDNTYIKYNEENDLSVVLKVDELSEQKVQLEAEIAELSDYSDEALLAWAKRNYPNIESQARLESAQSALQRIIIDLEQINGN